MNKPIQSAIRDNHQRGTVGNFISEHLSEGCSLSFVSAFFTIYAYNQLKNKLDNIQDLRFLFGEPRFISQIDPKTDKKQFQIEDDKLVIPIENRLTQSRIAFECANWIKEKCEIKSMVKPNFLHGKMYHIKSANGNEKAILGSSNFTVNGLGFGNSPNIELNIEVDSDRDRADLLNWFNELWNDDTGLVEDVKDEVLKYLSKLYAENSPLFIYYKTLYHIFAKFLEEQADKGLLKEKTGFYDSEIWNTLYSFQKDAVKGAINKLEKYQGCIIADSVGLGKTYEALAIIKYYEILGYRVLLLCPKKLQNNWTVYQAQKGNILNPFKNDRFSYTVAYHTDLARTRGISKADNLHLSTFNWGAWDLVVIDESHNLRGNPQEKKENGEVTFNRAKYLLEKVIKEGVKTKVLMLSATPVNTNLKDLRNQIYYITEGKDDALKDSLGIENISNTLRYAQLQFTDWAKRSRTAKRDTKDLFLALDSSFFKLLDGLTIARSRKHILTYYSDIDKKSFPVRLKPLSEYTDIDTMQNFCSYDKVNDQIKLYKLSLFKPSNFVLPEFKHIYEVPGKVKVFSQEQREDFLVEMMKINFLKRLESSIYSYRLTLQRALAKIASLEEKIEAFETNNKEEQLDPPNLETIIPEEELEGEEEEEFTVGKKLKYNLEHLDLENWKKALKKDKQQLTALYETAAKVIPENDAKLKRLKEIIEYKLNHPINPDNKKIIIFTAFADTAVYLYENLSEYLYDQFGLYSALITGSTTCKTNFPMPTHYKNDFNSILTCFAPIAKERNKQSFLPQDKQIDIIIGTDCISEGQNLQDCDYVINYDIHWNPVRIIQRFGRIDRINSPNSQIQMHNFWPTKDLDKYIDLKYRVETRMALVDLTATGADNILSEEDIENLVANEKKFRTKQLKSLQEEVIDLEDLEDSVSLTDFTLDDFRIDLLNYLKTNEVELRNAPLGLYAITPSPHNKLWLKTNSLSEEQKEIIRPGIIFCFQHFADGSEYNKLNPLQPYFLVYIRDDGTVRYHFTNVKQILEIYRLLTTGRKEAIKELCDLFDDETNNGQNMDKYNNLLVKAIDDIKDTLNKRSYKQLQGDRNAIIPKKQKEQSFELITWLIIK